MPGQVSIPCRAEADPWERTQYILWGCENVGGSETEERWDPTPPLGGSVTLMLVGLPSDNDEFGNTTVSAGVDCKSDAFVFRLYYQAHERNHPNGGDGTPENFFYYYRQVTNATWGAPEWSDAGTVTDYVNETWHAYIGPNAWEWYQLQHEPNKGQQMDRIDTFAWACRHEGRHRAVCATWFPNGWDFQLDYDRDYMKDSEEPKYGAQQGGPFDPDVRDTDEDDLRDSEDFTHMTQTQWTLGSADSKDWSCRGHQWPP